MIRKGMQMRVMDEDDFVLAEPPSEDPKDRQCLMCTARGGQTCVRCHQAAYCSARCQKMDWKTHKHVCETFAAFQDSSSGSTRPSKNHYRSVLFPADSEIPQWRWVEAKHNLLTLETIQEHLGDFGHKDNLFIVSLHGMLVNKGRGLMGICNDVKQDKNSSILALGKAGHLHMWPGSILVVGYLLDKDAPLDQDTMTRPGLISDLSIRDYRNILDGFLINNMNPCVVDPIRYPYKRLLAVKITCLGERFMLGALKTSPPIESCVAPLLPCPRACAQWASAYAFMLGLPWVCRVLTPACWDEPDEFVTSMMDNPDATLLAARFQFKNASDKYPGVYYPDAVGTVIIMDRFGQPIHLAHIQALNMFMRHNKEMLQHTNYGSVATGLLHDKDTAECLAKFDREHFEMFWERLKLVPFGGVNIGGSVPGPYERGLEPLKNSPVWVPTQELTMLGKALLSAR